MKRIDLAVYLIIIVVVFILMITYHIIDNPIERILYPPVDSLAYHYEKITETQSLQNGARFEATINYPVFEGKGKLVRTMNKYVIEFICGGFSSPKLKYTAKVSEIREIAKNAVTAWVKDAEQSGVFLEQGNGLTIDISVVSNKSIITLRQYGERYGGVHPVWGETYVMFDMDGNPVQFQNLFAKENEEQLKKLMLINFNSQYQGQYGDEHDDAYKTSPFSYTLVPDGLILQYRGCCFAEGNPSITIPINEIRPLLKEKYRSIFQ
jgi:hypothetical protein